MKHILKTIGFALIILLVMGVIVLAITGVPSPPAITTENMPRVPWKWAWRLASTVQKMSATTSFSAWAPTGRQMLIRSGSNGKVHLLKVPDGPLEEIEGLPDHATDILFPRDTTENFFVFSLDEGGSELYRHYQYDKNTHTTIPLTQEPARSHLCCSDPQGNRIAYSSTRRNGANFDLYLVDPQDSVSDEMVYQADGEFFPLAWSPDGRYLAVSQYLSHTIERLYLFDLKTRNMLRLFPEWGDSVSFTVPVWSQDGQSLYFASDYDTEFEHLWYYDLATDTTTMLSEHIPWDVTDLALTPDGTRIVFLVNEDGLPALYVRELLTGWVERIANTPQGYISSIYMHPWRNEFAINVTSASGFTSIYSYELHRNQWTRWMQPGSDEEDLPPVKLIHYPTFDSVQGSPRMTPAFMFSAAPTHEGLHPVLIDIHGGPAMQARPVAFNPMYNVMRQRGVTIIAPNVRGSAGYGKTYLALDDQRHREDAVRDIGALLDWIATQPTLDKNRVAVMGGSYGGYMTLASLTHYSDRLRCGCDLFGISNFNSYLEASQQHHLPEAQRAEFGDERDPAMRAFLDSISPVNQANRITVPVLIFQGANDVRVKPEESRQMVARIHAHGGTVYYIEAADEGHGLTQPLNLLYFGAAGMHILEECLLE